MSFNKLFACRYFLCFWCRLLTFKIDFLKKSISGVPSKSQTGTIQIRTDILSVLIWVQIVCKGYQQTTKIAASKDRQTCSSIRRAVRIFGLAHVPITLSGQRTANVLIILCWYAGWPAPLLFTNGTKCCSNKDDATEAITPSDALFRWWHPYLFA